MGLEMAGHMATVLVERLSTVTVEMSWDRGLQVSGVTLGQGLRSLSWEVAYL